VLYAAFGILDEQMIPEVKYEAWVIRYLIFCPMAFAVIVISYFKIFQRIFLVCLALLGFVGGGGILVMITLSSPPGSDFYYAGLLLTSMFYFVFLRLNFFIATALAWIIFFLYQFTAIFIKEVSTPVLINNSFFFVSFNITGMWSCYMMERYSRRDFIQRRQLTEQKEKLRMIFENSPIGILHFDRDGVITACNDSFAAIIGSPKQLLIGLNMIFDLKNCFLMTAIQKALLGETGHYEGQYVSVTSGRSFFARASFSPFISSQGNVFGGVGIVEDISLRKKTEMDLKESETRYRAVLESSPDPLTVYDRQGHATYVNPSFEKTFGWSQEELLGRRIDYVPEDQVARSMQTIKMLYEGQPVSSFETKRLTKDGRLLDINISGALVRNIAGDPIGSMITLRDITQQKLVEQELKSSEERYRILIESSPIGIGIIQNGKYVYANSALTKILGCYGSEEIVGESPLTFIADKGMMRFSETSLENVDRSQTIRNYEIMGLKRDGESFDASVWSSHIDFKGMPAILSFVIDVTQEKSLRAQLMQAQKMEAVGTLAGGVAHDFNNLLQAVIGYSEVVLSRKQKSDRDYADIQKIFEAGKRGAELVKNLLMFSQKIEPKNLPVDLNHEILQIQNLLIHTIPKTIKIDLELADDLQTIYADPNQLGQILLNLAVNSRDAMPDGGKLTISTTNYVMSPDHIDSSRGVKKGSYVLLTVSDTGTGIDDELMSRIFEPFFTTKEVGKGTGLGLATVYGIVKQHKGHIFCDSKAGVGATFRVYLPVLENETDPVNSNVEAVLIGGTETILLVEDEELVRDLGHELLSSFGYDVITAENGQQALEIFQKEKNRISLVILDLIMPEMDGRRCLKEMLQIDNRVRVLIASGYSEDLNLDDDILGSARGFIRKPFDMRTLIQKVREILDTDPLNNFG
ncbi:MAG: PAS domain S-box protein, partial [Pseudomonadota bacterium]